LLRGNEDLNMEFMIQPAEQLEQVSIGSIKAIPSRCLSLSFKQFFEFNINAAMGAFILKIYSPFLRSNKNFFRNLFIA
jgi:hypothetical protein